MTAPTTPPGFARLIAAVKGVGALVDWLAEPPAQEPPALPGGHCTQLPPKGWRCVAKGPHDHCILERGRP